MSAANKLTNCPGCGVRLPETGGPAHRYMESSPECWACFGDVLTREYSDLDYYRSHRLTVDTYAIQHPGKPSPQCIRSVALHGICLCAVLERDMSYDHATRIMQRASRNRDQFAWLEPPESMGALTIADVRPARDAAAHEQLVQRWARSAWAAWSTHHPVFRSWLDDSLAD